MEKLKGIVIGYGCRGEMYTNYVEKYADKLEIVGVAEPAEVKRQKAVKKFNLPKEHVFENWRDIVKEEKFADFAIISTQDDMHMEPALACIEKGYNLLLEKPIAPTPKECKRIYEAAEKKGVTVQVCHVLRFTPFYCKLKDIIDNGDLGQIMSVDACEGVGNIHQSHSFVRGNWRNEKESSCMLLAKCCHDMDIIQWLLGKECERVQSFGSLKHFTKENQPEGAPDRCLDGCPYYDTCYYSVKKIYIENRGSGWLRGVATGKPVSEPENITDEEVIEAMKTGPYGRCVYACDNDVVDHQVVNMEFEDGCTVSFSMNAFNYGGRRIRLFGTKGELNGDIETGMIDVYSFDTMKHTEYNTNSGNEITSGHGGGDEGIIRDFVKYLYDGIKTKSISSLRTSYLNHIIAFAAEESRLTGKVIDVYEYADSLKTE